MHSLLRLTGVFLTANMLGFPVSTSGHTLEFISKTDVERRILDEVTISNRTLRAETPPRYKIYEFEIEFSGEKELSGGGDLKIPLFLVGASGSVQYSNKSGVRIKSTFAPRDDINVSSALDFGLIRWIAELNRNLNRKCMRRRI